MVADLATLKAGRESYYLHEVAERLEDYYAGKGESPGRWIGPTAERLGLTGTVQADHFRAGFAGLNPVTGDLLGRKHPDNGNRGFDMVFRPVKSVSVLYGLGSERVAAAARDAQHQGVEAAVAYLDANVGARRGKAGAQGQRGSLEHVDGQGLLAAAFTHRQSRENDPLLHDHVIIFNRVQGPDGRWTAIDGRDVYAHRRAADAVYRATYQAELTRALGVEWGPADVHGNREVVGMPAELTEAMSKRGEIIETALEAERAAGKRITPELRRVVVSETRRGKEHHDEQTLRDRWRAEARSLGFDMAELERDVLDRTTLVAPDRAQLERLHGELASAAGLTERASTFTRADVVQALGDRVVGVDGRQLGELADAFLAGQTVSVAFERERGERRYSTPEMLDQENRLLAAAERRAHEDAAVVAGPAIRQALERHGSIGEDQARFVRTLTQGGAGVALGIGPAGTGKTFALDVARAAWELDGYRVMGAAPSGAAAVRLEQGSAIDSETVDRLLGRLDRRQEELDRRTVVVVDEAAMVGTRKLVELARHCERGGSKLVLVGDEKQLASVDAGGGFRALRLRLGAVELTENRRQRTDWGRQVTASLRDGHAADALEVLHEQGRVTVARSAQETNDAMVTAWWERYRQGADAGMVAYTRSEVEYLNVVARQLMREAGQLGEETITVKGREFAVGDEVMLGRNAIERLGVANGTRGKVVGFNAEARAVMIVTDDSQVVTLPSKYLDGPGEEGRPSITWAYAVTGHKEQGHTMDETFLRMGGQVNAAWAYVGGSRFRDDLHVFLAEGEIELAPELDLEQLAGRQGEPDPVTRVISAIRRQSGQQEVATDQRLELDTRRLGTAELRQVRDQLAETLGDAPRGSGPKLSLASRRRQEADEKLAAAREKLEAARTGVARYQGAAGILHPREAGQAAITLRQAQRAEQAARGRADQRALEETQAQQQDHTRAAWAERHGPERATHAVVTRELAWRRHASGRAAEVTRPAYLTDLLGDAPDSVRGRRAWRQTAAQVEAYRERYGITDREQALGAEQGGFTQRHERREVQQAATQLRERTQERDVGLTRERTLERGR